jgi:hypothetical protein
MTESNSVGDIYSTAKNKALKAVVSLVGVLAYVGGVIYAEVHGYNMLTKGIAPDMLIWAILGIFTLGISALALPVGLHYSFHDPTQRLAGLAFYALDIGLLFLNAAADFMITTGGTLPAWAGLYVSWMVPANPVIVAMGWSILSLLDPGHKQAAMLETLKAATQAALAQRIAEQAKQADISALVEQAAGTMARDVISQTLGASLHTTAPKNVIDLPAAAVFSRNGRKPQPAAIYTAEVEDNLNPTQGGSE